MPAVEILGVRLGWKMPPARQSQPDTSANPGTSRTVSQSHPLHRAQESSCGVWSRYRAARQWEEREGGEQAGDREIRVYRGPVNARVPVFAAKTWKYG